MSSIDWMIMIGSLAAIIIYGLYQSRGTGRESYIMAGRQMPWYTVLLGIMATQASAITFLSGPGQAYTDGMRFVQYYFGLPIAMIVIAAVFVPIFRKLRVSTAYEYLEQRFDRNTRLLTGILFLFSRGVSTGISVYAPSIILSSILDINIYITNVLVGGLLIIYTYTGGAKAIAQTQKIQFIIILTSMAFAGVLLVRAMPKGIDFSDALYLAGKSGKLNVITTNFNIKDKYNIWSGVIGGFFLALSYFGTDQSQVGRYISAKSIRESRLGLLMNGLVKIPMQFLILLLGALLFSFYAIQKAPISFNDKAIGLTAKAAPTQYADLAIQYNMLSEQQAFLATTLVGLRHTDNPNATQQNLHLLRQTQKQIVQSRDSFQHLVTNYKVPAEANDTNYIFLHFVRNYLPVGMIGLLFAVVFLASWGSISAALHALASSTLLDFHKLISKKEIDEKQELRWARIYTLLWGIFSIIVAMFATRMGSLIEAVNELGSLFYGVILGIFLTAFFIKRVSGKAVFVAAIASEILIFIIYKLNVVGFLWFNVIGSLLVIVIALLVQQQLNSKNINRTP
ncbi:sodium:solute symporter [Taibaiella sp. KBW10]|uniref:sodium:solute symporter n=1 Tax=Taibaiella sp. KBW10 TaxID=2153357 RepID=UPI000F59E2B6|nr:sodium:solute symporter [Taibaiella sp. KBW10]RQO32247.1 sodium:solute symporter [Taibaiella sp. KBW10]